MRAMLLAAGLGTRLRPLTYELPKPMVPILGRPVMEHILRLLARTRLRRRVANLHYFPDLIRERFGDGSATASARLLATRQELLGTAGGVRNVRDHFGGETFLIISGDALTDIDLTALLASATASTGGIATLALKQVDGPEPVGVVILDDDGRIQGFQEKPDPGGGAVEPRQLRHLRVRAGDLRLLPRDGRSSTGRRTCSPSLLEQDVRFYGHEIAEYWNDVGSMEEYRQGNFDALDGHGARREERPRAGRTAWGGPLARLDGRGRGAPVFIGEDCEIGAGVRLTGPVVIGDGCRDRRGRRAARLDRLARHRGRRPAPCWSARVAGDAARWPTKLELSARARRSAARAARCACSESSSIRANRSAKKITSTRDCSTIISTPPRLRSSSGERPHVRGACS